MQEKLVVVGQGLTKLYKQEPHDCYMGTSNFEDTTPPSTEVSSITSSPRKDESEGGDQASDDNSGDNSGFIKGPWTREEDDMLIQMVQTYGTKRWSLVASHLKGRTGKQCRERWTNQLNPLINKRPWSTEEDEVPDDPLMQLEASTPKRSGRVRHSCTATVL
jgi:hypothetical protein